MRCARPSTTAVLPTPGSPTRTGIVLAPIFLRMEERPFDTPPRARSRDRACPRQAAAVRYRARTPTSVGVPAPQAAMSSRPHRWRVPAGPRASGALPHMSLTASASAKSRRAEQGRRWYAPSHAIGADVGANPAAALREVKSRVMAGRWPQVSHVWVMPSSPSTRPQAVRFQAERFRRAGSDRPPCRCRWPTSSPGHQDERQVVRRRLSGRLHPWQGRGYDVVHRSRGLYRLWCLRVGVSGRSDLCRLRCPREVEELRAVSGDLLQKKSRS